METSYLNSISNGIYAGLLSSSPDPTLLQMSLEKELNLPADEARLILYQVIQRLNSSLFPRLTQVELILTEGCNLACSYCFEKNMLGYRKMPLDIAQAAVDLLFDYSLDAPHLEILHFGGEPTINFAAIQFVTEYAEEKAESLGKTVSFNMTSNGVLITDETADYFSKHKIKVLLSIDGLESTHDRFRKDKFGNGTFKKVERGLKILKRKQQWVGTKMTVMPQNVPSLFDDVLGLYEMGVNQFIIGHATGIKWSEKDIENFVQQCGRVYEWYKEKRRDDLKIDEFDDVKAGGSFGCQAGRNSISVSVTGEISPCSKILGLNSKQLLSKLGDVKYGLTHIQNRSELIKCSHLKSACESQGIANEYLGGCFVSNYDENHDLFKPSIQEHTIAIRKLSACSGCSGCKH